RGRFKMKLPRREFLHLATGAAALPAVLRVAWAQAYPARAVRVIVPFAPGGLTDVFARLAAQKLTEHFGRQFYVENISGASGNIGTGQAARSAPDGYTLLFAYTSHVVNPSVFAKIPYHPVKDFAPVTLAVGSATVLSVNPSLPARTVKELVALIKANPGKYNIASPGAGATTRAVPRIARARSRAGPIQWRWPGDCLGDRRSHLNHVQCGGVGRVTNQSRSVAPARGHRQDALGDTARSADHDRGGLSGYRGGRLGGGPGAGRNADRNHHVAAPREGPDPRAAGHEGAPADARVRADRKHDLGHRFVQKTAIDRVVLQNRRSRRLRWSVENLLGWWRRRQRNV